jgi:hypothetical protein
MSAATDLQDAAMLLVRGMRRDATLSLALVATWLDPLWFSDVDPFYDLAGNEEDEDAQARFALGVARACSPRLYMEAVQALRFGWTFEAFETAFCVGFRREYPAISLGSIEEMLYGVPLDFCGLDQLGPEFASQCPDLAAVLDCYFDVRPVAEPRPWRDEPYATIPETDFETASNVTRPVIRSLVAQDCQPYADLALMLLYLFSLTGNSLLDYTADDYWEAGYDALAWERERLAMAEEAHREARIVLDATDRALAALDRRLDIAEALRSNVATCKAALERNETHVTLDWPARGRTCRAKQGARRGTGPGTALFLVRDCYAEED